MSKSVDMEFGRVSGVTKVNGVSTEGDEISIKVSEVSNGGIWGAREVGGGLVMQETFQFSSLGNCMGLLLFYFKIFNQPLNCANPRNTV